MNEHGQILRSVIVLINVKMDMVAMTSYHPMLPVFLGERRSEILATKSVPFKSFLDIINKSMNGWI
jgi:hypothetical protein